MAVVSLQMLDDVRDVDFLPASVQNAMDPSFPAKFLLMIVNGVGRTDKAIVTLVAFHREIRGLDDVLDDEISLGRIVETAAAGGANLFMDREHHETSFADEMTALAGVDPAWWDVQADRAFHGLAHSFEIHGGRG